MLTKTNCSRDTCLLDYLEVYPTGRESKPDASILVLARFPRSINPTSSWPSGYIVSTAAPPPRRRDEREIDYSSRLPILEEPEVFAAKVCDDAPFLVDDGRVHLHESRADTHDLVVRLFLWILRLPLSASDKG